jgi:hypothetical protein
MFPRKENPFGFILQFTPTRKPYFGKEVKRGLSVIKIGSQKQLDQF